nr:recombination protein O N-terminal domain-containing protein [Psychromonas aquimarina]
MSIECHNAFILHRRPYRETSQLIDLFCRNIKAMVRQNILLYRLFASLDNVCL